jgi:hypothetical protein
MTSTPRRARRSRANGPSGCGEAKRRMDEQLWTEARANDAYLRFRAGGKDHRGWKLGPPTTPKPYTPPEVPPGQINTTDLDSRMVKGQHGFLQGYNAQPRQRAPESTSSSRCSATPNTTAASAASTGEQSRGAHDGSASPPTTS